MPSPESELRKFPLFFLKLIKAMIETFDCFNHCLFSFSSDEVFYHLKTEPEQLEARFCHECTNICFMPTSLIFVHSWLNWFSTVHTCS